MDADPPDRLASRDRAPLLLGVAAFVFTALWFTAWSLFVGRSPIHANDGNTLAVFGGQEARFLIAAAVVDTAFVAWMTSLLGRRWSASWDERWHELVAKPHQAYGVLAACAASFALIVALGVLGAHPISEDEKTYLYQAHLLLSGRFSEPVPTEATSFWQPFLVNVDGNWTGQYFWGQPFFLALGLLVHAPLVIPPLELAVTVFFTAKLAAEFSRDDRVGVVAALLAATSPFMIFTGATLHSANLSAACAATSLFAVTRLSREGPRDGKATVLLGVAVGVALHNRLLDEAALLLGAAIVIGVHMRGDVRRFVRSYGPAVLVALPFLVLIPIINKLAWGGYTTTGYALFNGHWKTMGFGVGPFGTEHTVPLAAAKTITVLVRLAFYETGSPICFALLLLPALGAFGGKRRMIAPLVVVVPYVVAYFFYAGSSIDPTGPVYYLGLTPVLIGWIALVAVELHDLARGTRFRRAVPAFLIAEALAGFVVFWPPQIGYLTQDVALARQCETVVADAGISRGLVFALFGPPWPAMTSWHRRPPMSWPPFDAPLLYAKGGGLQRDAAAVRRFAGDRPVFLARCFSADPPTVLRYDPSAQVVSALDGSDARRLEIDKPDVPERIGDYYPLFKVW